MIFRFLFRGLDLIAAPIEVGDTIGTADGEVKGSCCWDELLTGGGLGIVTFWGLGLVDFPRFLFGSSEGCGGLSASPALDRCSPGVTWNVEGIGTKGDRAGTEGKGNTGR